MSAAIVMGVALLAASCGSDDGSSSDKATTVVAQTTAPAESTPASAVPEASAADTTVPETTGGSDTTEAAATDSSAAGSDLTLTEPVVLVALVSDPGGTDQNAVPDFNDGSRLAVEEINAAGGIGGLPIDFQVIETLPTGDTVINSLNLALEKNPTAIIGPVSSTALLAISAKVDEAGVPMIHNTTEPKAVHDGEAGSQWIFSNRPSNEGAAAIGVKYAVEELGASKIGLMHTNTSFGVSGAASQTAAAAAAGVSISSDQSFEFNATDLTNAALAMDGSDVILDWGTPSTVGLAVNTLAQQGLQNIPHIGPGSVGFGFFAKIVGDASLLNGVLGVVDCNPVGDDRPEVKAFVTSFTEKYGYAPSYAAAEQYDSVYILKHVIETAGSDDPEAIRDGLESLTGVSGMCSDNYFNDNGLLNHTSVVAKFVDGSLETQKSYDVE
ncbi:MAG: ABC transporter substrate-binding protein [Ilumatobacteraceae bacterium]